MMIVMMTMTMTMMMSSMMMTRTMLTTRRTRRSLTSSWEMFASPAQPPHLWFLLANELNDLRYRARDPQWQEYPTVVLVDDAKNVSPATLEQDPDTLLSHLVVPAGKHALFSFTSLLADKMSKDKEATEKRRSIASWTVEMDVRWDVLGCGSG